ncbi:MAG: sigma-70 family RNA polymerase sigma factor [Jatrophihabitans sp.]|uniref:sigma-70 family RNA polymerase sigma factor n=1 Tax=Jatrophihabitans sp. TaxID=1932789 RepID=UPI003F7DAB0D
MTAMQVLADEPTIVRDGAAQATDARRVDELVRTQLPLVGHIVREFLTRLPAHVHRDDLTSAGMMALAMSARHFDPSRGVPFARFAAIRIRGAITDELRSMDWASRAVRSKARDLETARAELTATLGRAPRREELAQVLGVSVQDLDNVDHDVHRAATLSLQGLSPDQGAELLPSGDEGPESLLLKREQVGYLKDAIAELPERLRTVVEQYFFAQRKMSDIAAELGVTESRVSQMRSQALTMLRKGLQGQDDAATARGEAGGSGRREAADAAYCAAIAARSTMSGRLSATNVYGELRERAGATVHHVNFPGRSAQVAARRADH